MNHRDAFNDMPEEYREYVEHRPKGGRAERFASEERDIMASIEKECKPEKPKAVTNSENWESHEWAIRIRDIDKDPDVRCRRSLLRICRKIIDQSCIRGLRVTEYPATIPIMSTFLRDLCDTIIEMDDKATAVGEGPMHPDMIRAELQKAIKHDSIVTAWILTGFEETEGSHDRIRGKVTGTEDKDKVIINGAIVVIDMIESVEIGE